MFLFVAEETHNNNWNQAMHNNMQGIPVMCKYSGYEEK